MEATQDECGTAEISTLDYINTTQRLAVDFNNITNVHGLRERATK